VNCAVNTNVRTMIPPSWYRCRAEVDLGALRHNAALIRQRIGLRATIMAVVKADAYGHGLEPVASALMQCSVDSFGVANLGEAVALREVAGGGWAVLVFGSALPCEVAKMVELDITPTLSTMAEAEMFAAEAARQGKRHRVQIEVDTGMGRTGFWHEEAAEHICAIASLPSLEIEAIYTHFPSADENLDVTRQELGALLHVANAVRAGGVVVPCLHAANSAALLNVPEAVLDMVRPGLALYGIAPGNGEFRPVLSFKSRVLLVRSVGAGRTISYGQTFVAESPMRIATVAAGYADGFSRCLSSKAEVLIGGTRCRVVGRVTMDQIMVDVTPVPQAACGDEVVLIGRQGANEITAADVAGWAGTIPWEVLCGITKTGRVPRVYRNVSVS